MTPEEVLAVAEAGRRAGCKEALFSLGDQPETIFPEARAFLRKQGFERTLEYLDGNERSSFSTKLACFLIPIPVSCLRRIFAA